VGPRSLRTATGTAPHRTKSRRRWDNMRIPIREGRDRGGSGSIDSLAGAWTGRTLPRRNAGAAPPTEGYTSAEEEKEEDRRTWGAGRGRWSRTWERGRWFGAGADCGLCAERSPTWGRGSAPSSLTARRIKDDRRGEIDNKGEAAAFDLLRTMLARRAHALQGELFFTTTSYCKQLLGCVSRRRRPTDPSYVPSF
jgi:hypothetical protein